MGPDQLASKKPADLALHSFQNGIYVFSMVRVIKLKQDTHGLFKDYCEILTAI